MRGDHFVRPWRLLSLVSRPGGLTVVDGARELGGSVRTAAAPWTSTPARSSPPPSTAWTSWERYSGRQDGRVEWAGIAGVATTFGLGRYRLEPVEGEARG